MKSIPISSYSPDTLETLLSGIPFYKDLIFNDPDQMEVLKKHSAIYEPGPNEVVIEQGARDNIFYFLLSGQLIVYPDGKKSRKAVNYLTAGQALGVLALLTKSPRTATLVADPKSGRCQLIGTDFSPFGELTDFSQIGLPTKLALWRMVAHNTRWKLNVYKMQQPEHPLSQALAKVETFSGEKGSVAELESLDRQVRQLTELMSKWNEALAKA
ncbi:MAG TPA: cyclic nucleotide-binding domain-containing protein [Moraxellaceae bacterium]|nr:cyclic nucleotide-binding domain-containing protein [Moraxellaceae bacterium]